MTETKQRVAGWRSLAFGLLLVACGGSAHERAGDSGNTNWLKPCDNDSQCGELTCLCGSCRSACERVVDCGLEPSASCQGDASDSPAPEPEAALQHEDPDSLAVDLVPLEDGSVVLVGGRGLTVFEQNNSYSDFWLAKLDPSGAATWEVSEPHADDASIGRSVALTTSGELVALSTIFDGSDSPSLTHFDLDGQRLDPWTADAGFTLLRGAANGELFAAGSQLNEERAGRPFTSAVAGRISADGTVWRQAREGLDGSVSHIVSLDVDATGNLLVAGSLGTAPDSNESLPWVGALDGAGGWLWQHTFDVSVRQHCEANAAVLTATGAALVAGTCDGNWLRSYSGRGELQWERRFPWLITSLSALNDGGYAVGLAAHQLSPLEPTRASLLRFDALHHLLWRAEQPECRYFNRLVATPSGLLALSDCASGYTLSRYVDP